MHGDWRIICAHDGLLAGKQFGEGDRIERSMFRDLPLA